LDVQDETNDVKSIKHGQTIKVQGKDQVASTGASWGYQVLDGEKKVYKNIELVSTDYAPATNGLIGAPGTKIFTFKLKDSAKEGESFKIQFGKVPYYDHDDEIRLENPQANYDFEVGA